MLHPQEIAPSISPELAALAAGRAHDPFGSLGWHRSADGWTFRTLQPFAESVSAQTARGWEPLVHVPDTPLFELRTAGAPPQDTRLRVSAGGAARELLDPYSFPPAVGADDLWLFNAGAARQAWRARPMASALRASDMLACPAESLGPRVVTVRARAWQ